MNTPRQGTAPAERLLPLDTWRQLFLDELRARGASGRQVGDAWAEVETYCMEAHQHPQQAFGDPTRYAASLRPRGRWPWGTMPTMVVLWFVMAACHLAIGIPWVAGTRPVAVSWGSLALVPLSALFVVSVALAQHLVKRRPGWGTLAFMGVLGLWQVTARWAADWTAHALTAPARALWWLFAATVLVATALALRACLDRVIDPRTGETPSQVPAFWWWVLASGACWAPLGLVALRFLAHR